MNAPTRPNRDGFTLVEILVVIVIIGILAGLGVPAASRAIQRAQNTARKMEVNAIETGVEKYYQKYGDYPPDGSSWPILQRHMRKLFPRMSEPDNTLLVNLTHVGSPLTFSPVAMDRAEALVFFLGGFSESESNPLTGPGGPLEFNDYLGDGDVLNLANYQYNATRNQPLHEFETDRLDITLVGSRYVSNDENRYGYTGTALSLRGGIDLLPTFLGDGNATPIVYFDSRTYGDIGGGTYNGYLIGGDYGGVRPYKTMTGVQELTSPATYGSLAAAFDAVKFHNPNKFQIIHPGQDDVYGSILSIDNTDPTAQPVHFITETGVAVTPNASASNLAGLSTWTTSGTAPIAAVNRYGDVDWLSNIPVNGNLDNITNFSNSTLEGDLQ